MKYYTIEESDKIMEGIQPPEERLIRFQHRALRLVSRRDHSEKELSQKLRMKSDITDQELSTVIGYLRRLKYMPDEKALASRLTAHYLQQGRGEFWIQKQLRQKGLVSETIAADDQRNAALKTLQKKLGNQTLKTLDRNQKAKIARHLASRGFSSGLIWQILKDNTSDSTENDF